MRKRIISCLLFALVACVVSVTAQGQQSAPAESAKIAPTLRLKSVDGKTYDIADMRGSVVLASFGATWCVPCHAEVLALEELRKEYEGKPVRFLWVSIETDDEISDSLLRHRAKGMRLTMPVLRDRDQTAFSQFSARKRLPMVVVFDARGVVAGAPLFGMSDAETYKERVRKELDAALQRPADSQSVSAATSDR